VRFLRLLAALALSYQALAVAAANFPRDTALSWLVTAPFSAYLTATEQWQSWDMFDTIPYDHRFTVRAFAAGKDGVEREIGPLLPGLAPFREVLRLHILFYRLYPGSPLAPAYWTTYARRLCAAARAADPSVAQVRLSFESERLRGLAEIREDGRLANPVATARGPVDCLGDVP
jgi:hypothetical protein